MLLFAAVSPASAVREPTRVDLVTQYRAVMKAWDQDGDDKLSRSEIDRMIEVGLHSPSPLTAERFAEFKETMRAFYRSQDADNDGFVDANELVSGALATFDCMDADKNGRASTQEISTGMTRCRSW